MTPAPPTRALTGAFVDPALESEFQREHFALTVGPFTRLSIPIATAVFLAYGLHDALVLGASLRFALAVRYGFFAPIALAVTAFVLRRTGARGHSLAMLTYGVASCLTVLLIAARAPVAGYFIYTGYAVLFVTLGPVLARMNAPTEVLFALATMASHLAIEAHTGRSELAVRLSIQMSLASLGSLAVAASRGLEAQGREAFLQRRLIQAQVAALDAEQSRSEALLLNILPAAVAARLKNQDRPIADGFASVTVLFADLVGFTALSARLAPRELVRLLDALFSRFDALAAELGVEKIKTIGDAYMAVGGLDARSADHAERMVTLGARMLAETRAWSDGGGGAVTLRVGVHTGPVVAGVIGQSKFIYDVWGDTVNTASRMESHGVPGRVQVSEATRAMLGARWALEPRGEIEVKGKGPMTTFLVRAAVEESP